MLRELVLPASYKHTAKKISRYARLITAFFARYARYRRLFAAARILASPCLTPDIWKPSFPNPGSATVVLLLNVSSFVSVWLKPGDNQMGRPERRVRERKRAAASCRTLDSFLPPAKRNRSTSDSAHFIPAASIELERLPVRTRRSYGVCVCVCGGGGGGGGSEHNVTCTCRSA